MTTLMLSTRRWVETNGALLLLLAGTTAVLASAIYLIQVFDETLRQASAGAGAVRAALLATLGTALATGLGAVPVLLTRSISARMQDTMLGFSAGVMLAASVFSLILPALAAGEALMGSELGGGLITAAGILLGAGLLLAMDRSLPHEHESSGRHGPGSAVIARVWLFVFAIALHNLPEGLAVGVAFAAEGTSGVPLALGIAVQNMPEGLAVALAMLSLKYPPGQAVLIALATGLVEPLGGVIGAAAMGLSGALLPWGLAFAGGAMLFVVSHEIIPETHRNGYQTVATVGLFAGFVLMMMFDTMLG